MPEKFTADLPR